MAKVCVLWQAIKKLTPNAFGVSFCPGNGKLRKCRCILRKILMAVGIGNGGSRIGICQVPGGALTIDHIVSPCDHVEVTHFVDERAGLGIGAR